MVNLYSSLLKVICLTFHSTSINFDVLLNTFKIPELSIPD